MNQRSNGRRSKNLREFSIQTGVNRYAEGSALIQMGHTKVLCTASVQEEVPKWLEGKGQGWVTGEYSMLPRSTHTRSKRDREKVSGRTQEIQRLIGRALRAMVDLKKLGERSIIVDCDVLQADGGTRTASINGGCVALAQAIQKLKSESKVKQDVFKTRIAAISIGIKNNEILTDLDYEEDSSCDVDMNFVITEKGEFVEVQGTAENDAFTHEQLSAMTEAAKAACGEICKLQEQAILE